MTSKERSRLKSLANGLDVSVSVGKGGITDNVLKQIDEALEAHELIKVGFLQNAEITAREAGAGLAKFVRAECVQVLGGRVILYRFSHKEGIKHVEYKS